MRSTVAGLGSSRYISTSALVSTVVGLGSTEFFTTTTAYVTSTVYGLGYISTLAATLTSTVTGESYGSSLTSSINTLGALGYLSTPTLTSTIEGLGQKYISTLTVVPASLASTTQGLGQSYVSTPSLISTVEGLGQIFVSTLTVVPASLTSTVQGLGQTYVSTQSVTSTVQGLGQRYISTISLISSIQGLGQTYVSTASLFSSIDGLGQTYVSTLTVVPASVTSTVQGLGRTYVSTQSLTSTVQGLGQRYVSTVSLISSIQGLGQTYVSTASLFSSLEGLGSLGYISTIITDSAYITSTTQGMGTLGYISTIIVNQAYVTSTTQGLGRIYISTQSMISSLQGIGSLGYISTTSLTSTLVGLGNLYLSTIPSTSRKAFSQKITFNTPLYYTDTPNTVAGLNLWFDSTDPFNTGVSPTLGTTVSTWYDKSLVSNNATSGSCTVENDGYNYISFNSNSYSIPGNFFNNNYFTVFVVDTIEVLNTTTPIYIYYDNYILGVTNAGPNDNSLHIAYRQGGGINGLLLGFFEDDLVATLTPITTNVTRLWSITFGQSPSPFTQSIYLFGNSQSTRTASTYMSGGSGFRIGSAFGLSTYKGRIREILAYQGSMGTNERQRVEGYLAWKWGLKGNLPVSHPYYSVPPTKNFYPTSITGLRVWLDGKDPLTTGTAPGNGTTLSTWYDKSGYAYHGVGTGSPSYSSTGVSFNGSSRYYTIPYSGTHTVETGFIVFNPQNITSVMNLIAGSATGNRELIFYSSRSQMYSAFTMLINDQPLPSAGVIGILSYTLTTSSSSMYGNGTLNSSGSGGYTVTSETSIRVGANPGGTTNFFNGSMCEIMIFNTVLSTTDRQKIEGYLAWKWGVTLPGGHPYASAAPTI